MRVSSLGLRVEEASFFTGHLKNHDGQSVYTAAMSYRQSACTDRRGKDSRSFAPAVRAESELGHSVIELNLAKSFWRIAFDLGLHLLAADALARKDGDANAHLVAEIPPAIDPAWVDGLAGQPDKNSFSHKPPFSGQPPLRSDLVPCAKGQAALVPDEGKPCRGESAPQ